MFGSRSQVQMTRGGITDSPAAVGLPSAPLMSQFMGGATLVLWLILVLPEATGVTHLLRVLSPFNLMLLAGAAVILLFQGCRSDWRFSLTPTFQGMPLLVLLGTAIATVLARTLLDLEHLSVVGVVVGAYGLVGLFCDARTWKRGLPFMGAFAILLFLFALELTDLGHLARTAIAEIVELLLRPLGVGAISSEDILVLSTGIAFVDIPCSGFKNIEIGSLFFMAASLLERKRMGLRWLLAGVGTLALLMMANIARILVIVVLTFVLQQRTLAEILHVPLGLCGFITVCLLTLQLLRWVPRQAPVAAERGKMGAINHSPVNLRNAVITLGLLLGLALIPQPAAVAAVTLDPLKWPLSLHTQVIELTPQEQTFFTRHPGTVAQKQTFQFQGLSGSMIVVTSPTWQAHHAPELCLSASGFQLDQMQRRSLADDVTGRWLSLNQGQQQATYWFQSAQHTTDDYLDRVWREITRQDPQWTMVSILFDQPVSADGADVKTILEEVHGAIATAMT